MVNSSPAKSLRLLSLAAAALFVAIAMDDARAQFTFATDNADNYGGSWTAGSDGGTGFGGWGFTDGSASTGSFLGNPTNNGIANTNMGSTAFGMFANSSTGGYANRSRGFDVGMGIGDTFSFDWGINWDSGNAGGAKGFDLRADGTTIFNVNNTSTPALITTGSGTADSSFGTNNMRVTMTRTSTGYTFTMVRRSDGTTFSTNISSTATINNFNFYIGNQQDNSGNRNMYFDNLSITNSGVFSSSGTVTNANTFTGSGNLSIGSSTTLVLSGGGNNNYTGSTTISNGSTLVFAGSGTSQFASTIGGAGGSLVMSNAAGTVVLTNNNTYTGNTTIAAGTILTGNGNALGSTGALSVSTGGRLQLSNDITFGRAITLSGDGIGFSGALQNVSGNNIWSGVISNASGARINSDAGMLTIATNINSGTNNLYLGGAGNITVNGLINGTQTGGNGALFKDGIGTLTLTTNNSALTGLVRLLGGTISITNNNSLGSGTLELGGLGTQAILSVGTNTTRSQNILIQNNSTNSVISVASGSAFTTTGSLTQDGIPANTTKLGKSGSGTLILAGASGNTYNGQIQIGDGTVIAGSSTALGNNTSATARGIDLGLNITDVSQANNVALRASNGVTVAQSFYVAPNTGNALRTIGIAGGGSATFSNQFYLDGTLTVDGGANATDLLTISGSVVNTGGLNKIGSGTVILSGANTYTGQTTVANGMLVLTNGAALSDTGVLQLDNSSGASVTVAQSETIGSLRGGGGSGGNVSVANGATLTVAEASTQNYAGAVGGSGALTKSGAGQLNLSGANTYGGLTTISSGSLEAQSASALGSTNGATVVNSGANLKLFGGGSGISYDAEAVTLNGLGPAYGDVGGDAGALRSVGGGNNTWNGAITLGSSARINSDSAGGAGSLTIAGNIAGGNNVLFVGTKSSNNANMTISGALGGAGASQDNTTTSLFKDGASTLTLSGNNTFSGDTRISAGNLTVASGGTLGNGTSDVYISAAGSLTVNANATIASLREWGSTNGGTATIGTGATLTVSGNDWSDYINSIGGAGNLVKSGTGTMNLYGAQSYGGTTTVSGGKLSTGVALASSGVTVSGGNFETTAANILGDTASVTVNSGTYNLGSDDTIGALSGTGGAINLGANRLTTTVSSGSSSYTGGSISGAGGGLTKAGNGTFSLGGTHSYTGGTTVSGGELRLVGATLSASSSVSVSSGAKLGGYGSTGVLGGAGSIDPGNSPGILTTTQVNPSGGLDFNFEFTGLTPVFNAPDASVNDLVRITGATPFSQSLNGANIINVYFSGDALYTGGAAKQIKGGFFTDQQANFFSSISGATYNYYFAMSGGGTIYNGQNYMTQTQYQTSTGFNLTITTNTFAQAASFDGTTTLNGQIVQFEVIPEPTTYALLALSGIALGVHTHRRRLRRQVLSSRD